VAGAPDPSDASGASRALDGAAVVRGALVAGVVAVPCGIAATILADRDDPPGWTGWLVLAVLLGLVFGSALAAWSQQRGTPLVHGIVVALGLFVLVQVVGVLRRLFGGDPVSWSRIFSSAVLSVVAGMLGGLLGGWTARRSPPPGVPPA
jgi:putative membrane protein (TIGR04086 family)